ncbi:ETS homologous factor-like isoform X4 [Artemia franciscana]|uniref:ETS homologous factor-like isoform X4 n=1 Tax=Artemia franciscana TaxID=6661 RepID=UPI0032DA044C
MNSVELLGINRMCRAGKMPTASPLHSVQYNHSIFNPFLYDSSFCEENQSDSVCSYSNRSDPEFNPNMPIDDIVLTEPFPTMSKQVAIFSLQSESSSTVRWTEKLPQDWTSADLVDWLFDLASKFGVTYEEFNINAFSNLIGLQMARMPQEEFIKRDSRYGMAIYQAFQTVLATSTGSQKTTDPLETSLNPSDIKIEDFGLVFTDCDDQSYRSDTHFESHVSHAAPGIAQMAPETDASQSKYLNISYENERHTKYPGYLFDVPGTSQAFQTSVIEPLACTEDYDSISDEGRDTPVSRTSHSFSKPMKRVKKLGEKNFGRLWEFIRDLLHNPRYCPTMVRWENVEEGVFRIVKSEQLAGLWGQIKNNPKMTYEKLSRAMRYYYKSRVFLPVLGRRLVYKFGPNAVNWRPADPNFENLRCQQNLTNNSNLSTSISNLSKYEEISYELYP